MSDFLLGEEVSGTPLETQDLATQLADLFSAGVSGADGGGRLGSQGIADQFGINLGDLGLQESLQQLLGGGTSASLEGFQKAAAPGRQRARNAATGQLASQFGTAGGRHSRNLSGATAATEAQLNQGFTEADFNFFNQARQSDIQAMAAVLGSIPGLTQANLAPFQLAAQFANPGAPGFQEGALGEILGTFSTLASAKIGRPPAANVIQVPPPQ